LVLWEIKGEKSYHKTTLVYSSGFNIVRRKIKEMGKKGREKDGESLVVFPLGVLFTV